MLSKPYLPPLDRPGIWMREKQIVLPDRLTREPELISLLSPLHRTYPSFEELWERYHRNFTGLHVPKGEERLSLTVDVRLEPGDLLAGCAIYVQMPVFQVCGRCRGTGHASLYPCLECDASGHAESKRVVRIAVPPFTRSGTPLETGLDDLGIVNLFLRARILVDH